MVQLCLQVSLGSKKPVYSCEAKSVDGFRTYTAGVSLAVFTQSSKVFTFLLSGRLCHKSTVLNTVLLLQPQHLNKFLNYKLRNKTFK